MLHFQFVINGALETFEGLPQIRTRLAAFCAVPEAAVHVEAAAASIAVDANVTFASPSSADTMHSALDALSEAHVSELLGFTVLSKQPVAAFDIVLGAPALPPSPSPPPPPTPPPQVPPPLPLTPPPPPHPAAPAADAPAQPPATPLPGIPPTGGRQVNNPPIAPPPIAPQPPSAPDSSVNAFVVVGIVGLVASCAFVTALLFSAGRFVYKNETEKRNKQSTTKPTSSAKQPNAEAAYHETVPLTFTLKV